MRKNEAIRLASELIGAPVTAEEYFSPADHCTMRRLSGPHIGSAMGRGFTWTAAYRDFAADFAALQAQRTTAQRSSEAMRRHYGG